MKRSDYWRGKRVWKRRPLRTVVAKKADYSVVPQDCQIGGIVDKDKHLDRE